MKPLSIDFGNLIKSHRNKANISQSELAHLLKISSQLLYKYENNLSLPTICRFFEICAILSIKVDKIIDEIYNTCNNNINNNDVNSGDENITYGSQSSFVLGYQIHDPSNLKLFKKLRRKFTQVKCAEMQKLLFEVNKKLLSKSLEELQYINKILK
ncbi:MAG: helix-turn-helix domain-containing protein [Ignavibacteria bacterium]|nr:helix-turn-helix domain-containing protein [Ignavibacteria bacterium]